MKNISQFSNKKLSDQETTEIKGGGSYTFCEYYLNLVDKYNSNVDSKVLGFLSGLDAALGLG